jgi:hypothetical protein
MTSSISSMMSMEGTSSAGAGNSRVARAVSCTDSGATSAANTLWVPHSTGAATRACGYGLRPCPRLFPGRPKIAALACVSGTSNVVPSTATIRQDRYQAPGVPEVATGRQTGRTGRAAVPAPAADAPGRSPPSSAPGPPAALPLKALGQQTRDPAATLARAAVEAARARTPHRLARRVEALEAKQLRDEVC